MKTLVVASNNKHKLREIAEIFTEFEVRSQTQMGFDEEVEETGGTFAENALLKARAASKALGVVALADDSGLCVDALDGARGVYSARYCGRHGADKENRELRLRNLQGALLQRDRPRVPRRTGVRGGREDLRDHSHRGSGRGRFRVRLHFPKRRSGQVLRRCDGGGEKRRFPPFPRVAGNS